METINLAETFPHLPKAPIVEASLEIRVVPSSKWNEAELRDELVKALPDFSKIESLRQANYKIPASNPNAPIVDDQFLGFKLSSEDKLHVVQFNRDAFVFSRLKPYENWEQLTNTAAYLWEIYYSLLKPDQIKRIGLRYINRIVIKNRETVELKDYYKYPPEPVAELGWTLGGYTHHDLMKVPQADYMVNLIKTVQNTPEEIGLILDIDVFMECKNVCDTFNFPGPLEEMRWVKNKIFFSSITDKAMQEFK